MIKTNKKGFTILELAIVIAVIAIISAIMIPTVGGIITQAKLTTDQKAIQTMNTAIAMESAETLDEAIQALKKNGINIESLTPSSSNYAFVWDNDAHKILLYSHASGKIVFPDGYTGKNWEILKSNLAYVKAESAQQVTSAVANGGVIYVTADTELDGKAPALKITKDTVVELGDAVITVPNDEAGDGVFYVTNGTLTLNGNGTVNAVGKNDYSMAVWANGGDVIINGGNYTNIGAGDEDHYDLIYAKNGGKIVINGGTFKCETPKWTLNCKDNAQGSIVVKGGEFFEYDPSVSTNDAIYVANGYEVVSETRADGTWYIVVPTTNN